MKKLTIIIVSLLCAVLVFGCVSPNTVDQLYTSDIDGYVFVVFKTGDQLWTAPGGRNVFFSNGIAQPELENGQFAMIKADVTILEGGEAGFMKDPQINSLISCTVLDYQTAADTAQLPGTEEGFAYGRHILFCPTDSGRAVAVIYRGTCQIYLDGELLGEFDEFADDGDHTDQIKQIISRRNENE